MAHGSIGSVVIINSGLHLLVMLIVAVHIAQRHAKKITRVISVKLGESFVYQLVLVDEECAEFRVALKQPRVLLVEYKKQTQHHALHAARQSGVELGLVRIEANRIEPRQARVQQRIQAVGQKLPLHIIEHCRMGGI